jgi:salicylate hydroxylase
MHGRFFGLDIGGAGETVACLGGLTAALECAKQGFRVEVFEQANTFSNVGAGIQLSPNPSRVLLSLGLGEALAAVAFLPEGTEFRHWRTGRHLSYNALGRTALEKFGAPYYHIHRADLTRVLAAAAAAEPNITLHTNARITGFSQSEESVRLETSIGARQGAVLIGADGIHSAVRSVLFGAESATFTGNVAWRGLVPAKRLPVGLVHPVAGVWWGPGKHFVHYFVRGGELVNCVCVVEKAGWEVESWTEHGELAELKQDFHGWHETIETLINNMDADACFKWALFDRPPMRRWSEGRVTLLGDACHPTLPFMAQGAAMAIEDAAVLARCLAADSAASAALLRYESLRKERTAGIQLGSRRNAKVFHLRGIKAWARNRAVGRAGAGVTDKLYRYNALEVVS